MCVRRYNWIAILVLVFCYVICAIAGAANSASKSYGFVVIWTMLMALLYAVGGTMIVRYPKYRSALSVGFLIGVSATLINTLLLTAAISGANLAAFGLGDPNSSTQAVTAFTSLLLIAVVCTQQQALALPSSLISDCSIVPCLPCFRIIVFSPGAVVPSLHTLLSTLNAVRLHRLCRHLPRHVATATHHGLH